MPSKFDRLRAGEVVEIEPGRKGRLNLKDKTFETSEGRKIYVGDDPDFFPKGEEGLAYSREKENLERSIAKTPAGEFLYQFGNQGVAGAAKDWVNKLIQTGDNYQRTKRVHSDVSQGISERSPYTSLAATGASFIPDIALTKGMSATKAAPLLTAAHSGPRILEEPGQVAGEAAMAGVGGKILDLGGNYLNRVAQRRGESRAFSRLQQNASQSNIEGQAATDLANLQNKNQFNLDKQRVGNENAARMHQYNLEVNARQNRMIEAENAYRQNQFSKSATDAEIKRLENEFKSAQQSYDQALKDLPNLQKQAQKEYSDTVIRNAEGIQKIFPKDTRITTDQLSVDGFINDVINNSGLAGSKEASQASRVLKALFPEGESLSSKELSSKYKALENAIQKSPQQVQEVLSQYKNYIGERLPTILEDSIAYKKIMPTMEKQISKDINSVLKSIPFGSDAEGSRVFLNNKAQNNLKQIIKEIGTDKFRERLQSGEISQLLKQRLLSPDDMLENFGIGKIDKLRSKGNLPPYVQNKLDNEYAFFSNELGQRIDNALARYEIKAMSAGQEAAKKLKKDVKGTYGMAQEVPYPSAPTPPEFPEYQNLMPPPETPPMPLKPSLMGDPTMPPQQTFTPQPIPELPVAQTGAERMGDFMERDLLGGSGALNNPIAKLAGLKYLAGKAALPLEAGYLGMKGMTSPTPAGEMARMTFGTGGVQAIDMMARRYPSYRNGILENPQDRRSLAKEIEDDSEIPLEQKALLQSKINRGKSIFDRIQ